MELQGDRILCRKAAAGGSWNTPARNSWVTRKPRHRIGEVVAVQKKDQFGLSYHRFFGVGPLIYERCSSSASTAEIPVY